MGEHVIESKILTDYTEMDPNIDHDIYNVEII